MSFNFPTEIILRKGLLEWKAPQIELQKCHFVQTFRRTNKYSPPAAPPNCFFRKVGALTAIVVVEVQPRLKCYRLLVESTSNRVWKMSFCANLSSEKYSLAQLFFFREGWIGGRCRGHSIISYFTNSSVSIEEFVSLHSLLMSYPSIEFRAVWWLV